MFILAESPAPLQSIPNPNMMLPLAFFLVVQLVIASFFRRNQRAAIARMSPEDKLKLVDYQWQKGSGLRPWIGMIFFLPLLLLPSFANALISWEIPIFCGVFVLLVLCQLWDAHASAKRHAAAGLPADYIASLKRLSMICTVLMAVFLGWIVFDLHRILVPIQQNLTQLQRSQSAQGPSTIREREIGQRPPGQ